MTQEELESLRPNHFIQMNEYLFNGSFNKSSLFLNIINIFDSTFYVKECWFFNKSLVYTSAFRVDRQIIKNKYQKIYQIIDTKNYKDENV